MEKSGSKSLTLQQPGHELQNWAFDYVAGDDTTQKEMFQGEATHLKPYLSKRVGFGGVSWQNSICFTLHIRQNIASANK